MERRKLLLGQIFIFTIIFFNGAFSQTANFTADIYEGCNPLTVKLTNTGSTGSDYIYHWNFNDGNISSAEDTTYTFNNPNINSANGEYNVTFTITNKNTLASNSITKSILVKQTPFADLLIDSTNACVNGDVEFKTGFDPRESAFWDFGDGTFSNEYISQYVYHSYKSNGTYNVRFTTFFEECSDTTNYLITIKGPVANFSMSQTEACIDDTIIFSLDGGSVGVTSYDWDFDGKIISDQSVVSNTYSASGLFFAQLNISGPSGNCMIDDTIDIVNIIADFSFVDNRFCDQQLISFQSTSVGNDSSRWDFGNGNTPFGNNVADSFSIGAHTIKLKVYNIEIGCSDSIQKEITVSRVPSLSLKNDTIICGGKAIKLTATTDAHKITWVPARGLSSSSIFNPSAMLDSTITYYVTVTDTNTNCREFGQIRIDVTDQISDEIVEIFPSDTTICYGRNLLLNAVSNAHQIQWTPEKWLNNPTIFNPIVTPTDSVTYYVTVTDTSTNCRQYGQTHINVFAETTTENIYVIPNDTNIFIGDTLQLIAVDEDSLTRTMNFKWSPVESIINCVNCKTPIVLPLQTTTYILNVTDTIACYSPLQFEVLVNVLEKYIIGVPDAFTPGNDDINNYIKVDGKGIKKFIEFRIYNRWGTEVFYTDDMSIGWDGTYNGKLQTMDSYAYVIKAEMWDNNIITKKGTFTLLR